MDNPLETVQSALMRGISQLYPALDEVPAAELREPPAHVSADYCLPVFALSERVERDPASVARECAEYFARHPLPYVAQVEALGPYLNLTIKKELFITDACVALTVSGAFIPRC